MSSDSENFALNSNAASEENSDAHDSQLEGNTEQQQFESELTNSQEYSLGSRDEEDRFEEFYSSEGEEYYSEDFDFEEGGEEEYEEEDLENEVDDFEDGFVGFENEGAQAIINALSAGTHRIVLTSGGTFPPSVRVRFANSLDEVEANSDEYQEEDNNSYNVPDYLDGDELTIADVLQRFSRIDRFGDEENPTISRSKLLSEFKKLVKDQRVEAQKLVDDGDGRFGIAERLYRTGTTRLSEVDSLPYRILQRQVLGLHKIPRLSLTKYFVPNSVGTQVKTFSSRAYSGQFSDDGNLFYTATQDFKVRMYRTDDPDEPLRKYKTVVASMGQWTLTDATLSSSNQWLAYSSITNMVFLTRTDTDDTEQRALIFPEMRRDYGIWSLRFSNDGREVIAGTSNNSLMIMDVESNQCVFNQKGHADDVNSVCFADGSSHVLFSGSDDKTIRVWDRRALQPQSNPELGCAPAGVFNGHTEGITYLSPKGDGRYCLSNGKDQTMKLWDIRRMVSASTIDLSATITHRFGDFDYRRQKYPYHVPVTHAEDHSVMTYYGHQVLSTLIRCRFSPASSTGQRYVYTGSSDGCVYIYNLDGTLMRILDQSVATRNPDNGITVQYTSDHLKKMQFINDLYYDPEQKPEEDQVHNTSRYNNQTHVTRDAAWHPTRPYLFATGWDYISDSGYVIKHSFTTSTHV